jgi:hypothetical protein
MAKSTKPKPDGAKSAKAAPARSKKSVASASPKPARKKGRGPMNETVVKKYSGELRASLGDSTFDGVFGRLKDDAEVRQEEAGAIASLLLEAPVAPSSARGTSLGRILKLHNSLATFKLKQRAVGGRSAA